MRISIEALDKCMSYIADESKLQDLLLLVSDGQMDEDTGTKIASFILESVIVENLSTYQYNKLQSQYGMIGYLKGDTINGQERQSIKSNIEEKFSVGISDFLKTFNNEFDNEAYLLVKLRKVFKNYKFKKINIVNDYTILFFTFMIFDLFCRETSDETAIFEMADTLAKACFEELHNPYNKKAVTVSCESLLRYVKQFPLNDYRETYTLCFIKYIQALNNSTTLPDYIRYDIFCRFSRHIVMINTWLYASIYGNKSKPNFENEFADRLKVNKYISNKLQKFKGNISLDLYTNTLKELQKNISWLVKNAPDIDAVSKKNVYKCCSDIYRSLITLSELSDEGFNDEFSDIINQYQKLSFNINGENVSVFSLLCQVLDSEAVKGLQSIISKFNKDNPYIKLLLSNLIAGASNDEVSFKIREMYSDTMNDIYNFVSNNVTVESAEDYNRIIQYVDLDEFQFPILTTDENNPHYQTALRYILPLLC